jgi:hypothetical protein
MSRSVRQHLSDVAEVGLLLVAGGALIVLSAAVKILDPAASSDESADPTPEPTA